MFAAAVRDLRPSWNKLILFTNLRLLSGTQFDFDLFDADLVCVYIYIYIVNPDSTPKVVLVLFFVGLYRLYVYADNIGTIN